MNRRMIQLALLVPAVALAPAWADHFVPPMGASLYEGNSTPVDEGWLDVDFPQPGIGTETVSNGILNIRIDPDDEFSQGSQYFRRFNNWQTTDSDAWTVDFSMAFDPINVTAGLAYDAPQLEVFPRASATNFRRVTFYLGGRFTDDAPDTNVLAIRNPGTSTQVEADVSAIDPTFSITDLNLYRLVGTEGGEVKVYVNAIHEPVLTIDIPDDSGDAGRAGSMFIGMQLNAAPQEVDWDIDFIRTKPGVAIDAPLPEPATLLFLSAAIPLLLRRGRRSEFRDYACP